MLAAIVLRGEVVGLLHAGIRPGGRRLAEFDRELVALFAGGLTGVLERAVLEQTLQRHRADLATADPLPRAAPAARGRRARAVRRPRRPRRPRPSPTR